MKLEYIVAIGVRLFAIGLGISVLRSLSQIPLYWSSTSNQFDMIAIYGSTAAIALLALVLWKFPLIVTRKISDFPPQEPNALKDEAFVKLLEVGLILMGLYLLYQVISDSVFWIGFYLNISNNEYYDSANLLSPDQVASMIATVVELVMASYFILGHKKLAEFVWKVRRA